MRSFNSLRAGFGYWRFVHASLDLGVGCACRISQLDMGSLDAQEPRLVAPLGMAGGDTGGTGSAEGMVQSQVGVEA